VTPKKLPSEKAECGYGGKLKGDTTNHADEKVRKLCLIEVIEGIYTLLPISGSS
jgi:hypothetical protein